jgi:hypothetical protein
VEGTINIKYHMIIEKYMKIDYFKVTPRVNLFGKLGLTRQHLSKYFDKLFEIEDTLLLPMVSLKTKRKLREIS